MTEYGTEDWILAQVDRLTNEINAASTRDHTTLQRSIVNCTKDLMDLRDLANRLANEGVEVEEAKSRIKVLAEMCLKVFLYAPT